MLLSLRGISLILMLSGFNDPALAQATAKVTQQWKEKNLVPYHLYEKVLGPPGSGMARLKLPFPMIGAWDKNTQITSITVHRKALPYFEKAFSLLHQRGLTQEASLYGGSFSVRKMRGGDQWTAHSWGVEIDIDPEHNRLSWGPDRFKMDRRVVEAFEEAGFYWRGHLGYDAMSFSLSHESLKEIARKDGISIE
ncbi:M15 family metallopeptidase [Microvirga tunisiensis]|uniref:M15 family metallopeptidase n=1 Tax=Microvirga tunisiensis TaxID=2108360 RepID=A0A5N7MRT2_9HYPH|nr:M15 family metallopeptidase [Microvirga tunisiensis]MPR09235.1 M15 family metallopeptidase [Microvirga tunisiensis]MPR29701.1 M15 family metallopeptidase [Microvirga tunisiensis]